MLDGTPIIDATGTVQANKDAVYLWYNPLGRSFPPAEFAQNAQYKRYNDGRFYDIVNDQLETENLNDGSLTTKEQKNFDALGAVLAAQDANVTDRGLAPRFATGDWENQPQDAGGGEVTMTALSGIDASQPIEYQFRNATTRSSSNWQTSRTWTTSADRSEGFAYRMRDIFGNTSAWSASLPAAPSLPTAETSPAPGDVSL